MVFNKLDHFSDKKVTVLALGSRSCEKIARVKSRKMKNSMLKYFYSVPLFLMLSFQLRRTPHYDSSDDASDEDEELGDVRRRGVDVRSSPADSAAAAALLTGSRSASANAKSWEHLLSWWPDYQTFSGVFKDIAELPHAAGGSGGAGGFDVCRPAPLGDRSATIGGEEEYI